MLRFKFLLRRNLYNSVNRLSKNGLITQVAKIEQNFVDGRRVKPLKAESNEGLQNIDPSSGKTIGKFYASGAEEVARAVESASEAFKIWSEFPAFEKSKIFRRAAHKIRQKDKEIARLEVLDTGKTFNESCFDVEAASECLDYYAGMTHLMIGEHIPLTSSTFAYTRKEPLGICAGIGAWNFPFLNIAWKVAPALCCGNTMIYKPSPLTPLSSVAFAEILLDAGLPSGVLNIVQGGAETGNLLCKTQDIAKVSFTGSVQTGEKILVACAPDIKKVTLELGGKSPLLIFADCDIENAVNGALMANYVTQGEVCSNAARVYVEKPIFNAFRDKVVEAVKALRVGDPMDARTDMGAMISEEHLQKVLGFVKQARDEGANVLYGGDRVLPSESTIADGYYMSPCVMDHCTNDMTVVREEHFGPIMSILPFSDEEEVIEIANDTRYGLASGVFTKDVGRAHRVAAKLQAGTCYINTYNVYPVQVPFGGYKKSGIGRENGLDVLGHYTQSKTVLVETGDVPPF